MGEGRGGGGGGGEGPSITDDRPIDKPVCELGSNGVKMRCGVLPVFPVEV